MGAARGGKRIEQAMPMAGRGKIGEQIFAEVEQLTANGAMKRSAAIAQIAARTGSNAGTIAANYYRIARQRGVPLRSRRTTNGRSARGRDLSQTITSAIRAIEATLRSQEEELATLRKENQRFEKLRRLLRA